MAPGWGVHGTDRYSATTPLGVGSIARIRDLPVGAGLRPALSPSVCPRRRDIPCSPLLVGGSETRPYKQSPLDMGSIVQIRNGGADGIRRTIPRERRPRGTPLRGSA